MARIAVGGFQHETNCFVPVQTDYSYFASVGDRPPLCRGEDVLRNLPNKQFACIFSIQDIKKVFDREHGAVKHLRSLRPSDRDEEPLSSPSLSSKIGVLQFVLLRP